MRATAYLWIIAGEEAAQRYWTSGGRPEAPGRRTVRSAGQWPEDRTDGPPRRRQRPLRVVRLPGRGPAGAGRGPGLVGGHPEPVGARRG
ncbi:DUF7426 family protein [Micromonospora pallida]|uniref:DUF7426 family protein n=1 Tax=Micromonospora pallida TaxID=145854 RepID=UPI003CCC3DD4